MQGSKNERGGGEYAEKTEKTAAGAGKHFG